MSEQKMTTFVRGPEVKKLRIAAGITREQLRQQAECSYAHLRFCERGEREMSDELYHKLHLSLHELVREREQAFEQARKELAEVS